jgi:hypothetical protein
MTQTVDGPSLFCAGFAAQYVKDKDFTKPESGGGGKTVKQSPIPNPKKSKPKKGEELDPAERR